MFKAVLRCNQEFNFSIDKHYVPSAENLANAPSLRQSDLDCTLSEEAWSHVRRLFGPHTFDLMSLDSNSRGDLHGNRLPHFTPCHNPESSGINVFAQQLPVRENLLLRLQVGFLHRYNGTSGLFVASVKLSTLSILLARTDHLYTYTVLFSRFHASGKRPSGVRLVSIQIIMMRIFVRLVVHQ